MTESIRLQLLNKIISQLEKISVANGYNTSIGSVVAIGDTVDPSQIPCVFVNPKNDSVEIAIHETASHTLTVTISGISEVSSSDLLPASENMVSDIIENISGDTWSVDFTNGSSEITVGDTIIGAISEVQSYVTGVDIATGSWSGGDAAGTLLIRRASNNYAAENIDISGGASDAATLTAESMTFLPNDFAVMDNFEAVSHTSTIVSYPNSGSKNVVVATSFQFKYNTKYGNPFN